ncbi:MAG TPA: threonine synthase [Aggregatilinea sp.]|uniref:threonine synthase n=1 Tax=Aggregatilinea sp. TaxID=2806333 RepID=UPI002C9D14BD|nr:threonine synthase [Aggregatilinea sp.]HML21199.1 threonine synthase [Aggregatilinea sp.]
MFVTELRCVICGRSFAPGEVEYTCPDCGPMGTLDVLYDTDAINGVISPAMISGMDEPTLWRYRALVPLAADAEVPPLAVGWTPLYDAPRLADKIGLKQVWVKDDGRNPTGSLKDRASALIVARAMADHIEVVTTASTGNAAAALAGLSASVGLPAVIFVPSSAPEAKIAQLLTYGAKVMLVQSNYDAAFDLAVQASERYGWYNRNTGMNPYTLEGKKTVAFEIAEQLGWRAPDVVVVSVGDGNIISGVYKGFRDLLNLGWIDHMPRLIGVQASGSAAMYEAWKHDQDPATMEPISATTVADSISADLPRDAVKAMRAVRDTNGAYVSVDDQAILDGIPMLARLSGVFAEPAGAAVYAGVQQALSEGHISPDEEVVLIVTGNGLKDIRSAMRVAGAGYPVEPSIEQVEKIRVELGLPSFR